MEPRPPHDGLLRLQQPFCDLLPLAIEVLPAHVPLPAKIRTGLLHPIEVDDDPDRAGDDAYVRSVYERVEKVVQAGMDRLAAAADPVRPGGPALARRRATGDDHGVELADAVEELYGVLPEEFVATRAELQRRARADGDRALAAEIGGLAKPSSAAWLANALVRHSAEEITGLLDLGELLREAQANLAGDELRQLDVQRRRLIAALGRQARSLAAELGHPVSAAVATQVEETLRAAMTDPEAAEALRSGRLTAALSYSGLGTEPRPKLRVVPERSAPEPAEPERPRRSRDGAAEQRRKREEAARRAEEERRRRELAEAREAAEDATATAEEAAAAEEEARAAVAGLRERESAVAARIDELGQELTRLREERDGVGAELSEARRRRQAAARHTAEASARRERAVARVTALESALDRP